MTVDVLFLHGGGPDGYVADLELAGALGAELGPGFSVHVPDLTEESDWPREIASQAADLAEPLVVVAHSHGGAMALSWLVGSDDLPELAGVFLLASPRWGSDDDWDVEEFALPDDLAQQLPPVPLFLFHNSDDEVVPVEHLQRYAEALPAAQVIELPAGGHQFVDGVEAVAAEITAITADTD
ncbi:alpha/beta hydrolase [Mycobacterium sp. MYCO198283]|uniref:alpha/beta fold hydrolase n=1 Tax=Mycobacterium sp. MYCO198283 TaxID=2883505 RepID=UPI001E49816C|nr:alpha/beta fold hydrolase [Mycobacterium sp. MYCO198283]MCG5432277.1 alpha/beta hydrolase [Mycobacterium sp. MYCO198283]